jgi:hypothetical protein
MGKYQGGRKPTPVFTVLLLVQEAISHKITVPL